MKASSEKSDQEREAALAAAAKEVDFDTRRSEIYARLEALPTHAHVERRGLHAALRELTLEQGFTERVILPGGIVSNRLDKED